MLVSEMLGIVKTLQALAARARRLVSLGLNLIPPPVRSANEINESNESTKCTRSSMDGRWQLMT